MCSELAIKTPEDVIDVALVFLLLTFFIPFCSVTVVDFEQVRLLLSRSVLLLQKTPLGGAFRTLSNIR